MKGGVSQQQLEGVLQQQLGVVAAVKGGVALDKPYIYIFFFAYKYINYKYFFSFINKIIIYFMLCKNI